MTIPRVAVLVLGVAVSAASVRADQIDESLAVFDELCIALMPDVSAVGARAKSEAWIEITGKDLTLEPYHSVAEPSQGWYVDRSGARYVVRVGTNRTTVLAWGSTEEKEEMTSVSCSVELPRVTFDATASSLDQKYGPATGPRVRPMDPTPIGKEWRALIGDRRRLVVLYLPAEQDPNVRVEITFQTSPSFEKMTNGRPR